MRLVIVLKAQSDVRIKLNNPFKYGAESIAHSECSLLSLLFAGFFLLFFHFSYFRLNDKNNYPFQLKTILLIELILMSIHGAEKTLW